MSQMHTEETRSSQVEKSSAQAAIKQWFNNTYTQKGERYLRPVKAYEIFLQITQPAPESKLLDVACGLGRLLEAAVPYGCELNGVDLSEVAIAKAKGKLPMANLQVANAEQLPFAQGQFDCITCLGSLERMLDLFGVLRELHRVGHSKSQYCFLVRNSNTFIWQFFKQKLGLRNKQGHQNAMSLQQWRDTFHAAGFEVLEVYPDQYPLQKRKKWLSLGLAKVDYKKLIFPRQPLHRANEFIFVLRQRHTGTC